MTTSQSTPAIYAMSRRITVVLSQGRRLSAEQRHREDTLIAALLMHPQTEATVIADLTEIDAGSTDRLCLESIAGTTILFAWHAPATAAEALAKIGVAAQLLNHPATVAEQDDHVSGIGNKILSLHYFDLNDPESPEFYADRIAQVAEEADVVPVTLTNLADGREVPLAASEPNSEGSPDVASLNSSADSAAHHAEANESDDRDKLDDLMDALDQIDL